MTAVQACISYACAVCKHPACHIHFVQASGSSTLFYRWPMSLSDIFGLTDTCSSLHACETRGWMSDITSAFFKHLTVVDLICSLAVSEPSLATARVLEFQFWLTTFSTSRSICSLCLVKICVSGCHARYTAWWDLLDTKGQRRLDCPFWVGIKIMHFLLWYQALLCQIDACQCCSVRC